MTLKEQLNEHDQRIIEQVERAIDLIAAGYVDMASIVLLSLSQSLRPTEGQSQHG